MDILELEVLVQDLIAYCEKHEIEHSKEAIHNSVHSLPGFYHKDAFMQLRVNRKPGRSRELNWRCEILDPQHNCERYESNFSIFISKCSYPA